MFGERAIFFAKNSVNPLSFYMLKWYYFHGYDFERGRISWTRLMGSYIFAFFRTGIWKRSVPFLKSTRTP